MHEDSIGARENVRGFNLDAFQGNWVTEILMTEARIAAQRMRLTASNSGACTEMRQLGHAGTNWCMRMRLEHVRTRVVSNQMRSGKMSDRNSHDRGTNRCAADATDNEQLWSMY